LRKVCRPAITVLEVHSSPARAGRVSGVVRRRRCSTMCATCAKAESGDWEGLHELAANSLRHTYLCGCPLCGALWMGHAYTPQLMLELTPEEAAAEFPHWRPTRTVP
jgi:hypothetical protein